MKLFTALLLFSLPLSQISAGTGPEIDEQVPGHLETATFALRWFWGPDAQFGQLKGVYKTQVGYAGGTTPSPTYYGMGDHTESIEIYYDPKVVSYNDLLDIFWESHSPTSRPYSRQYMSMIMYNSEKQRRSAEASLKKWEKELGDTADLSRADGEDTDVVSLVAGVRLWFWKFGYWIFNRDGFGI